MSGLSAPQQANGAGPDAAGPRATLGTRGVCRADALATYGLVRLAGRAYSGNILRFGGRVTERGMPRP